MRCQPFFLVRYSVSWFKTMRSHILEAAGSNETGRLLFANLWLSSLSLISGIISANFHSFVNMDYCSELLTISVKIGKIHGSASLITAIETLSYPRALFDGKDITVFLISLLETCLK